jgi:hypothetical protein
VKWSPEEIARWYAVFSNGGRTMTDQLEKLIREAISKTADHCAEAAGFASINEAPWLGLDLGAIEKQVLNDAVRDGILLHVKLAPGHENWGGIQGTTGPALDV